MRFARGKAPAVTREGDTDDDARPAPVQHDGLIHRNVDEIVRIEERERVAMGFSDHLADVVTIFAGSMLYVWLHVVWFAVWIALNLRILGLKPFDEFPFGLLTMIVSLEAIFLSTFVLISQNRQALLADKRAKIDLQVNMISEQEVTKIIDMLTDLHEHLGFDRSHDDELEEMRQPTHVEVVAEAVEQAEKKMEAGAAPTSAADTER